MTGRSERPEIAPPPLSRWSLPRRASGLLDEHDRGLLLGHVRALLEAPTAPYFEDAEIEIVRRFVAERKGFTLVEDEHANLIVRWGKSSAKPLLAFSAHLDHPAFHYCGERKGTHQAELHGGVPERFLAGAALRFFVPGASRACATARVAKTAQDEDGEILVELDDIAGTLRRGSFGVFDLPAGVICGTRLHARVCDDLLGAAAILTLLDLLARAEHPAPLVGIFTRAEETGFVGAQGLLRSKSLPRELSVIGLECSPRRATAKVGRGPVVRVGDKQSVFDPELTHGLQEAAAALRDRHPSFAFQRALMDGGSCESTAYNLWGVPAGGMCLALGNYHNCGADNCIASEFVDWNDLEGLVALMREAVLRFESIEGSSGMRQRLQRIWDREYNRLARSSDRLQSRKDPQSSRRES